MIPAVFSAAGITLVVGQQIPAEILQPKVTGTASQYRHCTVRHSYGRGNLEPQTKGFTPKATAIKHQKLRQSTTDLVGRRAPHSHKSKIECAKIERNPLKA